MNMQQRIAMILVVTSLPAWARAAEVPYTELKVYQFVIPNNGKSPLPIGTPLEFKKIIESSCVAAASPRATSAPVAPLVAAVGGIFIDWLFNRSMTKLKAKLKKKLEEHSAGYSNGPFYTDVIGNDPKRWDVSGESCVILQRRQCSAGADAVKSNTASCKDGSEVGLSVAMKLRKEGNLIRVLPLVSQLTALKPKHAGGKVVVVPTARVDAIGLNKDDAGSLWKSPEVKLATIECEVSKADKITQIRTYRDCISHHETSDIAWERAQVIPMPPSNAQAIVFTVGEVGEPSSGLKGFADFLDATGDSMSTALSAAFQKKIGLKKE